MRSHRRASALAAVFAALLSACANHTAPTDASPAADKTRAQPTASAASTAAASAAPLATGAAPSSSAAAAASGQPDAGSASDAGAADAVAQAPAKPPEPAPIVADNQVPPAEGTPEELTTRARGLFDAIVKDEAPLGDPFWFPREPFTPLKDVKDPDKYWVNLHRAYANDIHKAHRKRKSWEGATFVDFTVGSKPKWVKPGDEANKIGYYRSFHGKIGYEIDGKKQTIDVHTVITWQGRWYVTHLGKFKK